MRPPVDMTQLDGRAGLTQRQREREPRRPSKPLQGFESSLRCSLRAEDLLAATSRQKQLEDYARELGFEVTVGAIGVSE